MCCKRSASRQSTWVFQIVLVCCQAISSASRCQTPAQIPLWSPALVPRPCTPHTASTGSPLCLCVFPLFADEETSSLLVFSFNEFILPGGRAGRWIPTLTCEVISTKHIVSLRYDLPCVQD